MNFIKHFNPEWRELYKSNKKWAALQETINRCKFEQKELEYEIRRGIAKPK